LRAFTTQPDLVLMWLTPGQAMLYSEAAGTCRWTEALPTPIFGRPSCAALPAALDKSQCTLSLGCLGMRIFTEVSQDQLLAVLPGSKMEEFSRALESVAAANQTMGVLSRAQIKVRAVVANLMSRVVSSMIKSGCGDRRQP